MKMDGKKNNEQLTSAGALWNNITRVFQRFDSVRQKHSIQDICWFIRRTATCPALFPRDHLRCKATRDIAIVQY